MQARSTLTSTAPKARCHADSQWNPVYNVFHRKFGCGNETILQQFCKRELDGQTRGQRSSRAAQSKRRAIGNYFSDRICYMFQISKCRGDRDLGAQLRDLRLENAAQGQIPIFPASKHIFSPEVATALQFSKRKSRSCAQT